MNNQIIVILGRKHYGKTHLAKHLIRDKSRVVIYDPNRQFTDCGVVINDPQDVIAYYRRNYWGKFRIVYQPEFYSFEVRRDILLAEFENICHFINIAKDLYFVVDEIDKYVQANWCPAFFNNLIQRGRHIGISLIVTTRRHVETSRHLTAQADVLYLFNQVEPNDIKYLRTLIGDMAQNIPSLPPRHFIKYENGIATTHEPI